MLNPDFPVIDGDYQMTNDWAITLDQPHNRRVEDGSLVIWRPGFTLWINVWNNDNNQSIDERLERIKSDASEDAYLEETHEKGGVRTFKYRLNEMRGDDLVYAVYGFVFSSDDEGYVQVAAYFDVEGDYDAAKDIIDGIRFTAS